MGDANLLCDLHSPVSYRVHVGVARLAFVPDMVILDGIARVVLPTLDP